MAQVHSICQAYPKFTLAGEARASFDAPAVGFQRLHERVVLAKPTVIIVGYGLNESFAGQVGLPRFQKGLNVLLDALAVTPRPRRHAHRPYVFTKCSMIWDERRKIGHSLKAESIRRECEASLRRLKVDALDLYQVHWPMPDEEIEEGWATMAKLKEEGKVRNIGVSNFDVGQMQRALAIAPITSLRHAILWSTVKWKAKSSPTPRKKISG